MIEKDFKERLEIIFDDILSKALIVDMDKKLIENNDSFNHEVNKSHDNEFRHRLRFEHDIYKNLCFCDFMQNKNEIQSYDEVKDFANLKNVKIVNVVTLFSIYLTVLNNLKGD